MSPKANAEQIWTFIYAIWARTLTSYSWRCSGDPEGCNPSPFASRRDPICGHSSPSSFSLPPHRLKSLQSISCSLLRPNQGSGTEQLPACRFQAMIWDYTVSVVCGVKHARPLSSGVEASFMSPVCGCLD